MHWYVGLTVIRAVFKKSKIIYQKLIVRLEKCFPNQLFPEVQSFVPYQAVTTSILLVYELPNY